MKRIGLIALALVLSLGLMGIGIANWTETLDISGSVATGELDVYFTGNSDTTGCDPLDFGAGGGITVAFEPGSDTEPAGSDPDNSKAVITITNAYPCWDGVITLEVHNNGTIPAALTAAVVGPSPPELDVLDIAVVPSPIGPCDKAMVTITIHVDNGDNQPDELETITFACKVNATQATT